MKIFIPAWHYRAPAIVQRTWGWSPIEEMVLLALDRAPGTMTDVAAALQIPEQVANSTVARLMSFGLLEVRFTPSPALATSSIGQACIRSNRALPERTSDREVGISLIFERVGQSVLRNRDVDTVPESKLPASSRAVAFPPGAAAETESWIAQRVSDFVARTILRPGEWLRGVKEVSSVLERKYVVLDLDDVKNGILPPGASDELVKALQNTIKTGVLPEASAPLADRPSSIETTFEAQQFLVGPEQHLAAFERIVDAATADVFVLSTFVASQSDEQGRERRERIFRALERAIERDVRCHLFFGTSLDDRTKNATAMQELNARLSALKRARGFVLVHRDPVGSHVKFVAADDGRGGAVVLFGSCNWLWSPFTSLEISVELSENLAVATSLDILRSITSVLSSASRAVETLQFMASELRRNRPALTREAGEDKRPKVRLTVVQADEHERLLRAAAHDAKRRFVCTTNKVGATMVPALFNPAEVAGRRLDDVCIYYSRPTGPTKRRHISAQRERLNGVVDVIEVSKPQVHAKFLAWDSDHAIVSSMNWGSQSGLPENPLDEIGLYLEGPDLATSLLGAFEAELRTQRSSLRD